MTDKKKEIPVTYAPLKELHELSQHVTSVLVDNAKTDTLVYGLLLSLQDEVNRGATRKTLRKEIDGAIAIAHEQFHHLFFPEETDNEDGKE